jgi:hypothetical protein
VHKRKIPLKNVQWIVKGWEVSNAVPQRDGLEVAGESKAELEMKGAEGRVSEYKRNWERR